jgi:hypothetical protein
MSGDISLPATPDSIPAPDISARPRDFSEISWEISEISQDIIGNSLTFLAHALDISYSTSITYDDMPACHLKNSSFLMLAAGLDPSPQPKMEGMG